MEKSNLSHSAEKRELDQECRHAAIKDGDLSESSTSGIHKPLDSSVAEPSSSNLPHSAEKRELDQECTNAAIKDGDLSESSASGIHEPLDPSVAEPSPKRQKVDLQSNEEQHLYELFQKILDNIRLSARISDEDMKKATEEIRKALNLRVCSPPADYSQKSVICGYLFRCATHNAGLARTRIVDAVRNCPKLKSALEKKGELRVVSIGGGPGSDALGFCSALSELGLDGWTSLCITVVDAVEEWRECVRLVDQYLREEEFGSVSKLFKEKNVTMSFVQANLPGDPDKDIRCYDALKNADIIIECKMMIRMEDDLRDRIIQALSTTIKDDALVLPIQSSFYDKFWMRNGFRSLYAPESDIYEPSVIHQRFENWESSYSKSLIRVLRRKDRTEPETNVTK